MKDLIHDLIFKHLENSYLNMVSFPHSSGIKYYIKKYMHLYNSKGSYFRE